MKWDNVYFVIYICSNMGNHKGRKENFAQILKSRSQRKLDTSFQARNTSKSVPKLNSLEWNNWDAIWRHVHIKCKSCSKHELTWCCSHTRGHQDKLHLYPFPRQQNNACWQSFIPTGPDRLLAAPQDLSGEFKLKIYWKCVELNTLYCSDETVLLVLKCNSKH